MIGEPSCGVSVAAYMQSRMWGGEGTAVASLYMSLLTASMVPPNRRLVVESSSGQVWISLYSLSASLHIDFTRLCLVSVRCIIVGLDWAFNRRCKSRIVLCLPLVLKVTALIGGCQYMSLVISSCCVFVCCFEFAANVASWVRVLRIRLQFVYCSSVGCLYLVVCIGGFGEA
jgi:hypothetical protein